MKVGGNSDLPGSKAIREATIQDSQTAQSTKSAANLAKKIRLETEGAVIQQFDATNPQDQVDVSLSKAISDQLSPEAMSAERRAKIADLKKRIADGTYNPSSEAVAKSLAEELMYELYSSGGSQDSGQS